MSTPSPYPREGYRPEWLALEDASGGRYFMVGDITIDGPTYNAIFSAIAKGWPQHEDELDIWDEESDASCNKRPVRIYKPKKISEFNPVPLVLFFPGGGYFAGNLDTEDGQCRLLAAKTSCIVISIDYEKVGVPGIDMDYVINKNGVPFVAWARKRATELSGWSGKTVLCGGSAGAFLAGQITYALMEKGDTDSINGLVLPFAVFYPYTYGDNGKQKEKFRAWEENGNAKVPIVDRPIAEYVWTHYNADFSSPRHFPGIAEDLSKWPPTYLITAEKDIFRDDGRLFHELLTEAGVRSDIEHYDGLPHYFHAFPALPVAHEMMAKLVEGIHFVLQGGK